MKQFNNEAMKQCNPSSLYELRRTSHTTIGTLLIAILFTIGMVVSSVFAQNVDVDFEVAPPISDPTNLLAIPGDSRVYLTWEKTTHPDLTDQIVYVSGNGGLTYFLAVNVGLVEFWTVYPLTNGVLYTFKVVSVDSIGRQSTPGAMTTGRPFGGGGPGEPCGNGVLEPGEECDDGNDNSGDGRSSTCRVEGPGGGDCGDGVLELGEECDDGNNTNGDGCSSLGI